MVMIHNNIRVNAGLLMTPAKNKEYLDLYAQRVVTVKTIQPRGLLIMTDGNGGVEYIHPSRLIVGQPGQDVRKNW